MFGEPLEEICESVEIMRLGFKEMLSNVRKAKIFCVHVMRHMPPEVPQLLVHVGTAWCLEAASRYRLSAMEAFFLCTFEMPTDQRSQTWLSFWVRR